MAYYNDPFASYVEQVVANARELANKKSLRWSVREVCIEGNTLGGRPTITAHFYITGTPGAKISSTELAIDLQNRLSGNSTPASTPEISKVIFNPPATIVLWTDKTKTVVKCQEGDTFDPEKGLAMAIAKKMFGNTGKYCDIFKKWVPDVEVKEERPIYPGDFCATDMRAAFDRLKRTAEQSTMSMKEALNSLYGRPEKETGWISVEDRLPETKGQYLVCNMSDCIYDVSYNPNFENDAEFFRRRIKYWMPLPEPPVKKTGKKGE
jgi:hypothetical protein